MFKKLLSNLSFNPSLINQVAFYTKRIHKEERIRRTGFIMLTLAFAIQLFSVVSPPQPTLASSNNDLITGGVSSVAGAVQACQTNRAGYKDILEYYGISCTDVSKSTTVTLQSTDYNRQLFSMGHLAYGKAGETPVTINNNTLWFRYLWSWDTAGPSAYQALKFTNSQGVTFFILYDCGNLVSIGLPVAPPALQITKATIPDYPANGSKVSPGQIIGYRVYFSNTGGTSANSVTVEDPIPANTTATGWQGTGAANGLGINSEPFPDHPSELHAWWIYSQMPAGATNYFVDYTVRVNNVADGSSICNVAYIRSNETKIKQSNQICMTVQNQPAPVKSGPPVVVQQQPIIPPTTTIPVCRYNSSLPANSSSCKPCTASRDIEDQISCLTFAKTASNLTQHIINADGTTAQPSDKIVYTLKIINKGTTTLKGFIIQDNLSDVLDYASITDLHGGKIDTSGNINWPATDIAAGQTVERLIDIKVKDQIPQTPASTSDPGHFDLVMTNTYGNTINIKVPAGPVKAAAVAATVLPNTGPGTSIIMAAGLTMVVAYFFARTRLVAKELEIVRSEHTSTVGAF
ncbi:MAG: hypothetical protein NVS1B7_2950 [Candidatus Saccharimonadales bacterium]